MTLALAAKSGSRGKIQDWCCQGLIGCSARIRKMEDGEICPASPVLASSAASSGPVHRDDPPRPPAAGQVLEPVQPAGGEPAPPLADRVHADVQVRGNPRAGPA